MTPLETLAYLSDVRTGKKVCIAPFPRLSNPHADRSACLAQMGWDASIVPLPIETKRDPQYMRVSQLVTPPITGALKLTAGP